MTMLAPVDRGKLNSNHEFRIQIGDVCCSITCRDEQALDSFRQLYGHFLSDEQPSVNLEVNLVEGMSTAQVEAALPQTIFSHKDGHFVTRNSLISGDYDLDQCTMSITLEKGLISSSAGRAFMNRAIYLMYYSACKIKHNGHPPSFLIHTCSIIRHGQALIFTGPSGTGKTTVARFCGNEHGQVINDETVLLSQPNGDNGELRVSNVPVIGEFPPQPDMSALLKCVFLLKQSQTTGIRPVNRMEAYLRFMRQIIAPAYIGQADKRAVYSLIAEFSDVVTRKVPFYELEFTLDKKPLWEALEKFENPLKTEA